jgi:UDP-N-acetylmuramate dehydrogenase
MRLERQSGDYMKNELFELVEQANVGKCEKDVPLSKHTTYKVGGKAKVMVYPKSVEHLIKLLKLLKSQNIKHKVLGLGSNVLFSDDVYDGVIIRLSELDNLEFFGRNKVRVGAGYSLMKLSLLTARKGLAGLEFASGIPGTVGGAVFMNAGAYKSDMGYVVTEVKVLTPELKIITLENKEMNFHYRTSFLQTHPGYICLEAVLKLTKGDKNALDEVIKERRQRRMESQPLEYPSAGSVFRNPEGMFAGKLIEDIGLKGKTIGGAMVSEKHANFIINYKKAKGSDIKKLIELVHQKVLEEYDVDMKIEQEFVNWE